MPMYLFRGEDYLLYTYNKEIFMPLFMNMMESKFNTNKEDSLSY